MGSDVAVVEVLLVSHIFSSFETHKCLLFKCFTIMLYCVTHRLGVYINTHTLILDKCRTSAMASALFSLHIHLWSHLCTTNYWPKLIFFIYLLVFGMF